MMNLQITTTDKNRKGDVFNAFQEAMKTTTRISLFIKSLEQNIGNSLIGRGGNHIWIKDKTTGEQLAIISGLFDL